MRVYLLNHDDRMYDMGDSYVRGVYATRGLAEADIVTRTPSGARSTRWDAHNESCCGVEDWDVLEAEKSDVKEGEPPYSDDNGGRLIPDSLAQTWR